MASHGLERDLTQSSAGFSSKEDYKRRREALEEEEQLAKMRKAMPVSGVAGAGEKAKKAKKKEAKKMPALSFDEDVEGEAELSPRLAPKKMGKCQDVDVSFLKKNESEETEAAIRQEEAMREYLTEQAREKDEPVTLQYTFRSETTQRELPNAVHRGRVTVRKGNTAEEVAKAVYADTFSLGEKFRPKEISGIREERDVVLTLNSGGMTTGSFVVPPTSTLVELTTHKWVEGTPLFSLEDGVVVTERRWFEQWKHSFPYSHWRIYEERLAYSHAEFVSSRGTKSGGIDPVNVAKKGAPPPQRR